MAQLTGLLAETLSISGAQLVKVFGTEEIETERVRAKGQELLEVKVKQALTGRWFTMVLGVITSVGPALVPRLHDVTGGGSSRRPGRPYARLYRQQTLSPEPAAGQR